MCEHKNVYYFVFLYNVLELKIKRTLCLEKLQKKNDLNLGK